VDIKSRLENSFFAAVAGLLLGVVAFFGIPSSALDASIHAQWLAEFNLSFRAGDWYPRWLSQANGGLGSPVFYFYPPFPYWICSVIAGPWLKDSSPQQLLLFGFALSSAAAGVFGFAAAYAAGATRRIAFILATLFVLAPNHFGNVMLTRGAYAEHWAGAWTAAVLWRFQVLNSVQANKVSLGGRTRGALSRATIFLTVAIAGLLVSHLLSAMLFLPILAVVAFTIRPSLLIYLAFAGLGAAGLAAGYLLPIAELISYTAGESSSLFKGAHLELSFLWPAVQLGNWEIAADSLGLRVALAWCFYTIIVGVGFVSLHQLALNENIHASLPIRWFFACWVCLLMMTPLSQPIYDFLPGLRRIQFAYRFLTPAAAFLLVGFAGLLRLRDKPSGIMSISVLSLITASTLVLSAIIARGAYLNNKISNQSDTTSQSQSLDANGEYLPRGGSWTDAKDHLTRNKLPNGPGRAEVLNRTSRRQEFRISGKAGNEIVLPLFFFPSWAVIDIQGRRTQLSMHPGTGLAVFQNEFASNQPIVLVVEREMTRFEFLGMLLSGVCWFLVTAGLVVSVLKA
jgi:hypothetical protein